MLQRVLQSLLQRYFGEFIAGLDKVELAFWTGTINIQQASLKHDSINHLLQTHNLPLSIKFSHLGALKVDIPWNKLASAPVQITLKDLYLVLRVQRMGAQYFDRDPLTHHAKLTLIKQYIQYLRKKTQELGKAQGQQGFMQRLLVRVLHNVNLQISGVHIRIQSHRERVVEDVRPMSMVSNDEFVDCRSEWEGDEAVWAVGVCIQGVEAFTVNQRNERQFIAVEGEKSFIRKNIFLRGISCYWEQEVKFQLQHHPQMEKLKWLSQVIDRKEHRLLTIDGNVLLEKNHNNFDYYFSTHLQLLALEVTHTALKQMIALANDIRDAQNVRKVSKIRELEPQRQLQLEKNVTDILDRWLETGMKDVQESDLRLLQCVGDKLLMQWTRIATLASMKKSKLKSAYQMKNKSSWLGFIRRQSPMELSEQQVEVVDSEIKQLQNVLDSDSGGSQSVGVYVRLQTVKGTVKHPKMNQQLEFESKQMQTLFEKKPQHMSVNLSILDTSLTYRDHQTTVPLFQKRCQERVKLLDLHFSDSPSTQKADLRIEPVRITHQIQFLGFVSQLIRLSQQQQARRGGTLARAEAVVRQAEKTQKKENSKRYEYRIGVAKAELVIQVDEISHLIVSCQKIQVFNPSLSGSDHRALIKNFGIHETILKERNSILEDVTVAVQVRQDFNYLNSVISQIRIVLNEERLFAIGKCLMKQQHSLQIRQANLEAQQAQTQSLIEGQTQILDVFKNVHHYHTVLTPQQLLFYQMNPQSHKIDYSRVAKTLQLRGLTVTRVDDCTFKLDLITGSEIVSCTSQHLAARWFYQIEQRVFELRPQEEKFKVLEESVIMEDTTTYDKHIEMKLGLFQIQYWRSGEQKIMTLQVRDLEVLLRQNSLQFQRKIMVQDLHIINETIPEEHSDDFRVLLSNIHNYFQDIDEFADDHKHNITVELEGLKKAHPKYTGQLSLKAKINKVFVNFCPQFIYRILYRLVYGEQCARQIPQYQAQHNILQMLKDILGQQNGIQQKCNNASEFEYSTTFVDVIDYRRMYGGTVLFHVEIEIDEAEIYFYNGNTNMWLDRIEAQEARLAIDKGTDFTFIKGALSGLTLSDITGYPQTNTEPFTHKKAFTFVKPTSKEGIFAALRVGVFPPYHLLNKQRFKNVLQIQLFDADIQYQQQPFMRTLDYLINQIVLFIMEPFQLHKFDTPNRAPYRFPPFSLEAHEIKKMLYESMHPTFTHLNIIGHRLNVHFNSHPGLQQVDVYMQRATFKSAPYRSRQRIHVKLDQLQKWRKQHLLMNEIEALGTPFEQLVSKSQWLTRYLITGQNCRSPIFENQFNLQMYFERCNHGQKPMLLPFLKIDRQIVIQCQIKHLNMTAPKSVYDMVNKCFIHNLSFDDQKDGIYNLHHPFESKLPPNKLIMRMRLNQLQCQVPELDQKAIIIQQCEYRFVRHESQIKDMEINGKSLHILSAQGSDIIVPLSFEQQKGLEYMITMKPDGQKTMISYMRQIDLNCHWPTVQRLFQYFILPQACYPHQDVHPDMPVIKCDVFFINSYLKIVENSQHVYSLKGDAKVNWTRYSLPHYTTFQRDSSLFPYDKEQSSYDIDLKGTHLRKYKKEMYSNKINNYRTLSSPIYMRTKLANLMRMGPRKQHYTDLHCQYILDHMTLKLTYSDQKELSEGIGGMFGGGPPPDPNVQQPVPHLKHKTKFGQVSIQLGLSQLPVPLLDLCLTDSNIDYEKIGTTIIVIARIDGSVSYWNMLIGRWQPIVEKSLIEATYRKDRGQYMTISSNKFLINLSIEGLKVARLLWKDIEAKGQYEVVGQQKKAKGIQITPYVITNRTGMTIFIDSDNIVPAKLRNNDKMHIQSRNLELGQETTKVSYQLQGQGNKYDINLNLNQPQKPIVLYNHQQYRLNLHAISSPVLKQLVISSPLLIHNRTAFPMVLCTPNRCYNVQSKQKIPIPFTEDITDKKTLQLSFPHLIDPIENYEFRVADLETGYEHYIMQGQGTVFNCMVEIETGAEHCLTVSSLCSFINLLPLDIHVSVGLEGQKGSVQEMSLKVSQEQECYCFGIKQNVQIRVKFQGFNYSAFKKLNLVRERDQKEVTEQVPFIDYRGLPTHILCRTVKKGRQRRIYLYADHVAINQSPYRLFFFSHTQQLLPGQRIRNIPESQSKFLILHSQKDISLGFNEQDHNQARKVPVGQLGDQLMQINNHDCQSQIVVRNSVICVSQQAQIFTSILKLLPRYVVVNKCTRALEMQQARTDQTVRVEVGQMKEWGWYYREEAKLMTMTAVDNEMQMGGGWSQSAPLDLETLEEGMLLLRPKGRSADRMLIRLQIMKDNEQKTIIFHELTNNTESQLRIKNNLNLVQLQFYQQCLDGVNQPWTQHKSFRCEPMKQVDFGWDYPQKSHTLIITFKFLGPYRSKFNVDITRLQVDQMQEEGNIIEFEGDNGERMEIKIKSQCLGMKRTIIFEVCQEILEDQLDEEALMREAASTKAGISFNEIGISLIGGTPRSQILFVSVRRMQLIVLEKQNRRNYELKIKYINIDNNLHHNTVFPVLFTPLHERKTMQKPRPFFVLLAQQNTTPQDSLEFNYLRLCLQPVSLKLHDELVTCLYDWQRDFTAVEQVSQAELSEVFGSYAEGLEWERKDLVKAGGDMFLRQVEIGKVVIEVTFSMRPTASGNIIIYTIFTLFKTALSNVSESQMSFNRFFARSLTLPQLTGQLSNFYRNELFKEAYKIAGSINLLGNPYVFVRYLAEGVWEVVNQPSEGFIKGPIEGVIGIGKGGVYFIRNVVAGTFNSFEVAAQSCSRGISYVTFDEKFMARREKIQMQKSRHIGQGVLSAGWALYTGLEVAVTGIVRHPIEEKEKSGNIGVVKGLAMGLTGLFTKPLSGFFEAASKFSQGVKQTALFFQDGPNPTRSRPPRLFISEQNYFTEYNLEQSKAVNLLQFHSTKHLKKTILFVSVDPLPDNSDTIYTVLTSDYLARLSKAQKTVIRQIRVAQVKEVEMVGEAQARKVKLKYGNDMQMDVWTTKYRELYECFKDIFENYRDGDQEEEESESSMD